MVYWTRTRKSTYVGRSCTRNVPTNGNFDDTRRKSDSQCSLDEYFHWPYQYEENYIRKESASDSQRKSRRPRFGRRCSYKICLHLKNTPVDWFRQAISIWSDHSSLYAHLLLSTSNFYCDNRILSFTGNSNGNRYIVGTIPSRVTRVWPRHGIFGNLICCFNIT